MLLRVHPLPSLADPAELAGGTTIVVDQLRASTTICHALAAGAECVTPFVEVDETLGAAERFGRDKVSLGGERGGKQIPGFDLGNSPSEYMADRVAGRRVLFTTTNGAKALHHSRQASRILVGSIVNRRAVVAATLDSPRVDVLCAGTRGEQSLDDVLAAGAIVARFIDAKSLGGSIGGVLSLQIDDGAMSALRQWNRILAAATKSGRSLVDELTAALRETTGGRDLVEIGMEHDLATSAQLDALAVVPEFSPATGEIRNSARRA